MAIATTKSKKILLTGFEPFGSEQINPSWEVVQSIDDTSNNCLIYKLLLPVSFRRVDAVLATAIEQICPDVVLLLGQSSKRVGISLERIAINIDDSAGGDNDKYCPTDATIRANGQNAYFSTLPIKAMLQAVASKNISVHISNSAGTYVCNHAFYVASYLAAKQYPDMQVGFIHVPHLPLQVADNAKPTMSLNDMHTALKTIIQVICNN